MMIANEYGRNAEEQELFSRGLEALSEKLGDVDAAAFIALVNRNQFDYTEWRRDNLFKDMSLEDLNKDILEYAKTHNLE